MLVWALFLYNGCVAAFLDNGGVGVLWRDRGSWSLSGRILNSGVGTAVPGSGLCRINRIE